MFFYCVFFVNSTRDETNLDRRIGSSVECSSTTRVELSWRLLFIVAFFFNSPRDKIRPWYTIYITTRMRINIKDWTAYENEHCVIWPECTYEFLLWGVIRSSEAKACFSTIVLKPVNLSASSIFSTRVVASTKFYRITQWKTKEVCSVIRYCMCGVEKRGKKNKNHEEIRNREVKRNRNNRPKAAVCK